MSTLIARQMISAELLKLRKKRSLVAWALFLTVGTLAIYFGYAALDHASDPSHHGPAGGVDGFARSMQGLAVFVGPLAAALIGVEAGAGDLSAGVFRDRIATGRSRLALFLVRIPAALAFTTAFIAAGFGMALLGTFILAGGDPTPGAGLIVKSAGWVVLSNAVICMLAVGLASLIGSRVAGVTALIGWELVVSPQLVSATSLGAVRKVLVDAAVLRIEPGPAINGTPHVPMSIGAVLIVLLAWPLLASVLGAWRTAVRDA